MPRMPGSSRVGDGLASKNILVAENPTKSAKMSAMTAVDKREEIFAPRTAPTKMPGATEKTTRHRTAPRLLCAYIDERDVKTMVDHIVSDSGIREQKRKKRRQDHSAADAE